MMFSKGLFLAAFIFSNFAFAKTLTTADYDKITEIYHRVNVITVPPNATDEERRLIGLINAEEKWLKPTRTVKLDGKEIAITLRDEIQILRWQALKKFGPEVALLGIEEKAKIDAYEQEIKDEILKAKEEILALKKDKALKRANLRQAHPISKAIVDSIDSVQAIQTLVLDGLPYVLNNNNGSGAPITLTVGSAGTASRLKVRSSLNGLFCSGMSRTLPTGLGTTIQVDINYARLASNANYNPGTSVLNVNTENHNAFCVNELIHRDSFENPGSP